MRENIFISRYVIKLVSMLLRRVFRKLIFLGLKKIYLIEIIGKENIPASKTMILLGNQQVFPVAVVLEEILKSPIHWAVLPSLYKKNFFLNLFLKFFGCFLLNPMLPDTQGFRKAFLVLEKQRTLGFYPGKINTGVVLFSLRSGYEVLPVATSLENSPHPSIKIVFGKTFNFSKYKDIPINKELVDGLVKIIAHTLETLNESSVSS